MMKFNEELLSAYLDDELTADEKSAVERELLRSSNLRQLLEELKSIRSLVSELPTPPKLDDATAAIMARAERMMVGMVDSPTTQLGQSPAPYSSPTRGRLAAYLAIAATLLLAFIGSWQAFSPEVAMRDRWLTNDNQAVPANPAPESAAAPETASPMVAAPAVAAPAPRGRSMKQSPGSMIADSAAKNMAPDSIASNASEAPKVMGGAPAPMMEAPAPMMARSAQPDRMLQGDVAEVTTSEGMAASGMMVGGMGGGMGGGGFMSPDSIPASDAASSTILLVHRDLPQVDLETRFGTKEITTEEVLVPVETLTRFFDQQTHDELNLENVENLPAEASLYYSMRIESTLPPGSPPNTSGATRYGLAMGSGGMGGGLPGGGLPGGGLMGGGLGGVEPSSGGSLVPGAPEAGLSQMDEAGTSEAGERDLARGAGRLDEGSIEGETALLKESRGLGNRPKKSVAEAAPTAADPNQDNAKPGSDPFAQTVPTIIPSDPQDLSDPQEATGHVTANEVIPTLVQQEIRLLIPRSRWEELRSRMNLSAENLAARFAKEGASGNSEPEDPLMLVVLRVEPENRVQLPEEGLPPSPNPSR